MSLTTPSHDTPRDHAITIIVSGLIKTMWASLGNIWLDHLKTIHESERTRVSPVTLASLRDHVRLIHALKPQAQSIHSHYFHDDIEGFLQKANIQSMRTYITHYLQPIMSSIQKASEESTSSTQHSSWSSLPQALDTPSPERPPQHVRTSASRPANILRSPTSHPTPQEHHTLHPALEETPHRKRARRRIFSQAIRALSAWARRRTSSSHST
jgi:hypothetical protein